MIRKTPLCLVALALTLCASRLHAADTPSLTTLTPFVQNAAPRALVDAVLRDVDTALQGQQDGNEASRPANLPLAAFRAVARYVVLARLFPDGEPGFTMELALAVADLPEDDAKAHAMAAGRSAAERVLRAHGF